MKSLLNKGAIVTGTSSGFGFETAKLFAKEVSKVLAWMFHPFFNLVSHETKFEKYKHDRNKMPITT
jgi:NAD(P)-dependent dehydrogenase (short-subunit alcohol dehydrogenase family)